MRNNISKEYQKYLRKKHLNKGIIIAIQIGILLAIVGIWELLAQLKVIDTFIFSCPSRIILTIGDLYATGNLFHHIFTTLSEALIGFLIATIGGYIIAILLWSSDYLRRVLDPYIVVLNSLPKVALGPIIIIWVGVGTPAIITMDILIMIIISIITMLNAFRQIEDSKIMLLRSMGANKFQILFKLIIPGTIPELISLLKINVGLTWVGTIMGEYLVSRAGLGYLIIYGSQVFNLDLVMTGTILLCVLATLMYFIVAAVEKIVNKHYNK
ncbi:MAG: ABC transporter permease [Clostridiales bacterium]|nr:ABC transporter permease [Clostridiales bacterium]